MSPPGEISEGGRVIGLEIQFQGYWHYDGVNEVGTRILDRF
jgi:hypothetical protein